MCFPKVQSHRLPQKSARLVGILPVIFSQRHISASQALVDIFNPEQHISFPPCTEPVVSNIKTRGFETWKLTNHRGGQVHSKVITLQALFPFPIRDAQ